MSNIEKIRQEIERRKNEFYKKLPRACYPESCNSKEEERAIGIYGELTDLLSFINSLPEEKPSKELEEAADEYADDNFVQWVEDDEIYSDADKIRETFIAGAKWQKEQLK